MGSIENTKTVDEAPAFVITRADGSVEHNDKIPTANPKDTALGLLILAVIIYIVIKLLRKL